MSLRESRPLVSNLPSAYAKAKRVVSSYCTRMQIEESFRDLKAPRHGFAMREHQGRDLERTANFLRIAKLCVPAHWLMGWRCHAKNLHRKLQANAERKRRVLPTCFLGRISLSQAFYITAPDVRDALVLLRTDVREQ